MLKEKKKEKEEKKKIIRDILYHIIIDFIKNLRSRRPSDASAFPNPLGLSAV
jgi:hypothetical protein